MRNDFRAEKEAILEKASNERQKRDDKIRETQIMADKQLEDLRTSTTLKRLKVEKQYEETKERLEKEKKRLTDQVSSLSCDASESGNKLERIKSERENLQKEFNKVMQEN